MDHDRRRLVDRIIVKHRLATIEDVLAIVPRTMCHVLQEPKVHGTYQPEMVRMLFPENEWDSVDANYRHIRDNVIPAIPSDRYLELILADDGRRLPCFCTQMADVVAPIVAVMLDAPIYILRNIFVRYLYLPQRWHAINAIVTNGRVRYFDASAYAQVIDPVSRRVVRPHKLVGFNASDVDPSFIVTENWLQSEPYPRAIRLSGGRLTDTFDPSPIPGGPPDEFFRVVDAVPAIAEITS